MELPENLNLIGVVLAGGKSSRMGVDKAELSISGKSMLLRTQELLTEVGAREVIICRNEPGYVADIYPHSGPVGGIYSALEHLLSSNPQSLLTKKLNALLIVPIDMPLLDKDTLIELTCCGAQMYSPLSYNEQQFPLFLPLSEEVRDCARAVVTGSGRSMTSFLNFIGCASITTTKELPFLNTNNPAQWQAAIEQLNS